MKHTKEAKIKDQKRRTQVQDMPQPEKKLTKDEQKRVKGGQSLPFMEQENATSKRPYIEQDPLYKKN